MCGSQKSMQEALGDSDGDAIAAGKADPDRAKMLVMQQTIDDFTAERNEFQKGDQVPS